MDNLIYSLDNPGFQQHMRDRLAEFQAPDHETLTREWFRYIEEYGEAEYHLEEWVKRQNQEVEAQASVDAEIEGQLFLIEDNLNAWQESVEENIAFIMENVENLKACLERRRQTDTADASPNT